MDLLPPEGVQTISYSQHSGVGVGGVGTGAGGLGEGGLGGVGTGAGGLGDGGLGDGSPQSLTQTRSQIWPPPAPFLPPPLPLDLLPPVGVQTISYSQHSGDGGDGAGGDGVGGDGDGGLGDGGLGDGGLGDGGGQSHVHSHSTSGSAGGRGGGGRNPFLPPPFDLE